MSFNAFFHPFFQILDDPFPSPRPRQLSQSPSRQTPTSSCNNSEPFFFEGPARRLRSPAVEINEEGDHYVVEAELPGVRKEDVDVRIGDSGRSLTIEGRSVRRFGRGFEGQTPASPAEPKDGAQGKVFLIPQSIWILESVADTRVLIIHRHSHRNQHQHQHRRRQTYRGRPTNLY